jgi:hypothetical protein
MTILWEFEEKHLKPVAQFGRTSCIQAPDKIVILIPIFGKAPPSVRCPTFAILIKREPA